MTEQLTRAVVSDLYAAYARGDVGRLAEVLDDDVDWSIFGPPHVFPFAGHRRGKAAALESLGRIAEHYALKSYEPEVIIVDGDRAAVMSKVEFTDRTSERALRFHIADFLRFRDGRLVEFREFTNTFDVVEQALGRMLVV